MRHRRDIRKALGGYPKEIILNDGTGVTIRPVTGGDARSLHDFFMRLTEDDRWFLNHDVRDLELIHGWVAEQDPDRVLSVVALLQGRIIANAVLMLKVYGAKSHIGKVRICVDPGYRERRLGTWMLLDLHNLGMDLGLKRLTMQLVRDRDVSLIGAVGRLDFRQVAVLENYVLDRQGIAHDLVIMTKTLPEGPVR
ncbi:MAG: N-acetyltransferase [Deltaproteobacteria bacterium]|nr:N-acetyltransferase [Deltaproteobacteria bacterium]MBW1924902.1 N-acetyltransferase [Deltaproteobacteria bacterium]MBW1950561.1 N-acetyltransferase [Deltaproteobacteria bacterium]MBW2008623.1 N-acetyltransferase [Deltaproteobacteria bacterium]MBW2348641.1 N-acetyltransferase [Deltaproteobacteria bacterium]